MGGPLGGPIPGLIKIGPAACARSTRKKARWVVRSVRGLLCGWLKHPQRNSALLAGSIFHPRDRQICLDLYEHKVLTAHHLVDAHFQCERAARRRMLKLFQQGVVQRFRPNTETGSAPFHFLLGDLGAVVVAAKMGVEVKDLKLPKIILGTRRGLRKPPLVAGPESQYPRRSDSANDSAKTGMESATRITSSRRLIPRRCSRK